MPALNVHRVGSGPPLVLLHGIGHHWQAWRPVIDLLAGDFDVLAVDLPGFGRSPALPADVDPTVPAHVDAIAAAIAGLGVERPHVAGNSMGGAIALELARRDLVASATALSPAGFWSDAERRFCQASLGALAGMPRRLRPAVLALARTRVGRALLLAQLVARPGRMPVEEVVATLQDAWAAPGFAGALEAFSRYAVAPGPLPVPAGIPVCVAWGARDRLLPARLQAPRARRALPGAEHVLLGTGHVPFSDDPAAVAATIAATAARRSSS